jgi:hypothetical protein
MKQTTISTAYLHSHKRHHTQHTTQSTQDMHAILFAVFLQPHDATHMLMHPTADMGVLDQGQALQAGVQQGAHQRKL